MEDNPEKGRRLAMEGAEKAAASAGDEWKAEAYAAFCAYAATATEPFITEDVRRANPQIPEPPDGRAWGGIVTRAKGAGVVVRAGFKRARDPKVHRSINPAWIGSHV